MGGVYLAFFLPALMGLFGQVGGTSSGLWRSSFGVVAVVGIVTTLRLFQLTADGDRRVAQVVAVVLYAAVGLLGAVPELASVVDLAPLQAEAILLILLIVVAHGLVWRFMTDTSSDAIG